MKVSIIEIGSNNTKTHVYEGDSLVYENNTTIEGTGLGLAIVKHIVQYYKGTIHLESELGKGTTFKVVLPIIKDSL